MKWFLFPRRRHQAEKEVEDFIRQSFGIRPGHLSYYEQALRHSSVAEKIRPGLKNSNERLEFLGDAVLDSIVAHYLYTKYPSLPEGELTKMKSKVVRRENLNLLGYALGIESLLKLNLGRQEMHDSIVGNAVEAMIGAIYLDKGFDVTREIVLRLLKQHGLDTRVHDDVDYKSKLHEWCQKHRKTLDFRVVGHSNRGGSSHYKVVVRIDDEDHGSGEGGSKKTAEQNAARIACEAIFKG
ncbi:MAG: ribonuclease III [Flavobacteriales bacterium]|jgi:ribonuclease-3